MATYEIHEGSIVHVINKNTDKVGNTFDLDFFVDVTDINGDELILNAVKNILIQWIRPALFRKFNAEEIQKEYDGEIIRAEDFRPERKAKRSRVQKTTDLMGKMTYEEFRVVILDLNPEEDEENIRKLYNRKRNLG